MEQLAALGGGKLIFLYVHSSGTGLEGGVDLAMLGTTAAADEAVIADATARLDAEVAGFKAIPANAKLDISVVIGEGRPADAVVALAEKEGAEQIVVGSHGRRGLERMLLGSVAERIVRLATCRVLVVKEATS